MEKRAADVTGTSGTANRSGRVRPSTHIHSTRTTFGELWHGGDEGFSDSSSEPNGKREGQRANGVDYSGETPGWAM
eukprot:CAMPEP_0196654536 /NCGR_PEP_ID=MMETSP1086-20130531/4255_1 /TAXON_ID=77921 /ORGANISM="Cyanoptyche  gloeocystis , Strain SAG4.97" /LENGTH=75 /DNA_ID=CAMNT_0041986361 /DNA_START=195 /DNA_END=422 /DNA_ORIENTATION=+